jgi:hypothetical protein
VRRKLAAAIPMALLLATAPGGAYSIFTHQQLIDLAWDGTIRPVLLQRYPGLSAKELGQARAYAYGGSIIQDMGYYPVGRRYFSDLTHYVCSGDFVVALLQTARNADELAFAIGALSHYVGDSIGHSEAINQSTGIVFPGLQAKYGPDVAYDEAPIGHGRVEFGFDVAQIAQRHFAPQRFRKQIGFAVAHDALDRALLETYALNLRNTIGREHPGVISYRFCARELMPLFARTQRVRLQGGLKRQQNSAAAREYLQAADQTAQAEQWSGLYRKPGAKAHLMAFLFHFVPPVGALKIVRTKAPTAATDDLYVRSVNHARELFEADLKRYAASPAGFRLENLDLDTGRPVAPGRYRLTDQTCAHLLDDLTNKELGRPSPELAHNILAYYADPNAPIATKRQPEQWKRVQENLAVLKSRYP